MTDDEERPTPREFDWAKKVFDKMLEAAEPTDMIEGSSDVMVYKGHLTKLFAELEVPNPYYTKIMKALKEQSCVEQLRRGGGAAKSEWILIAAPSEEGFRDRRELKRPNNSKWGQIEQQIRDLRSSQTLLAESLELHQETITLLEDRLTSLGTRVDHLEGTAHETDQLSKVA